jgi:hypothetical protein
MGDDYNGFPGVKKAVDQFAKEKDLKLEITETLWRLSKK